MDLSFLKQALPTIATALGGPLAGLATGFIADKLNLSEKTTEAVTNIISGAGPEQMLELKKLDNDLKKYFADLGIKELEIEAADRDSARKREMEIKDSTPKIMAYVVTVGFFGILTYLLTKGFPDDNKEVLIYMLGSLSTAWTGIMAYYYGSTKGSADKTKVLASAITGAKE